MQRSSVWLALISSAAFVAPACAYAQAAPATPAPADQTAATADDAANQAAEIVVTGTSVSRVALDTPLAITSVGEEALSRRTATSQADILNSIPTIKADAGGGEVAANVFIRGLPSNGQYQFTPLMYDGIDVLSSFGVTSSAYDIYYRNDLGISRLEFVRGGVSNLFGPGSVAGLINYISKTGSDKFRGTAQLEVAEKGRYRGDLAVSGPLSDSLSYAFSGFYRYDEGPIRTNLKTQGFQLRGNLKFKFSDGSGNVTLFGQYIDDKVVFYLPVPLNGPTRKRIAGNDGQLVNSVQNNFDPALLSYNTPSGLFTSPINDGVTSKGGQIALSFTKDLGSGWGINGRAKYSYYKHKFGIWSDGDGIINVPETLQGFLTQRGLGTLANAAFTFNDGNAVPANYLLFANRITDRTRPMQDITAELNITKSLSTGSVDHTFTLGGFYGRADATDFNNTTVFLAEFNNQPRLINLVVTNPITGAKTIVSRTGLLNAGSGYANNHHVAERKAIYFADQMQAGRFNFDIGGRYEKFNGDISRERTATFVTDSTTPNLSTAIRDVIWGNGQFTKGRVSTDAWALAGGALYKLTDRVSIYANASRGYFFPEIRSVTFTPTFQVTSYKPEIIRQAEVGIKIAQPQFTLTVAGLYTDLKNRRQVLTVNDGQGGFFEKVNLVATRSWAAEATLDLKLMRNLRFNGNLTIQNAKYTQFDTTPAFVGNELERQPNLLYNAGLYYDNDTLDASLFTNYTGDNFTASNNTIPLKGWNVVTLDAGYKVKIGGSSARISINVYNLFNSDAVTEGSPRQDTTQTLGGAYFVGRPLLPRRITGRITLNF